MRIPAIIEIPDEGMALLQAALSRESGATTQAPRESLPEQAKSPANRVELPSSWRLTDELHGVTYTWPQPEGPDVYDPFRIYEGTTGAGTFRLAIGFCERTKVRGKDRKYVITHHIGPAGGKRAIAEFLETDDYDETGEMIAIIKGKGGGAKMYDPSDELPPFYAPYRIETYRDRIDYPRSYEKLGIVASDNDHETMLNHTLFQIFSRGLDQE